MVLAAENLAKAGLSWQQILSLATWHLCSLTFLNAHWGTMHEEIQKVPTQLDMAGSHSTILSNESNESTSHRLLSSLQFS